MVTICARKQTASHIKNEMAMENYYKVIYMSYLEHTTYVLKISSY